MIDVCKDCEFRHMCVDASNLEQRADKSWYRAKECNYNPYISKWVYEEGYKTLSDCGITVTEQQLQIDTSKLHELNVIIWGDQ